MTPQSPKRFPDRDEIARVRTEADRLEPGAEAPESRRLAGRVLARRDLGKLVFLDLVDRSGRIQLLCPLARTGEVDVHLGDVVGATGHPTKSRRGEASLVVDELVVLSRIRAPLPDTFHGLTDVEQRYRRRYLDLLMNEEVRADFLLRARIVSAVRRFLDEEGFVEVETPVLQPRYGGGFAEPFVTHSNELDVDVYLRIATELYLKRLIVGGLEKVYELGKDFRNEGRQLQAQPRVHAARVVRGLCGLPRHDEPHGAARRVRRRRGNRDDAGRVPWARGRTEGAVATRAARRRARRCRPLVA